MESHVWVLLPPGPVARGRTTMVGAAAGADDVCADPRVRGGALAADGQRRARGQGAGVARGLCLLGLAEASYRLGRSHETIAQASEALELLSSARRRADAQRATYWLAAGHHASDDPARARMLFEELLAASTVEDTDPDLRVRILIALATVEAYAGEPNKAIGLLEEARAIGADLDDRRRATLL